MTAPESPDNRRSFTSRTPVNDNPEKVVYRRGFVTRHQVTGWRFVMRRIASGVALHDTRMLVDPLRTQTRAVGMGVVVLVTALAGCFVFSLIRPNGSAANNAILADRETAALYVRVGDQLHPVLNLASARLITGKSANPTMVKSAELDKFPLGNLIGIPGAPQRLVQNTRKDADWTVCDAATGTDAGVTVIAGAPDSGGARAAALDTGKAVLVGDATNAWLLWEGRRSRVGLADHAVTSALGFGTDAHLPRPISAGLFNAIPESPPLAAPVIADAGSPAKFPVPAPIGGVVESHGLENDSPNYYAVLPDGLQQISPVLAAILRNANSYGLDRPPHLGADKVTKLPVSRQLDTGRYPERRISLLDATHDPVTCVHWSKASGASTNSVSLLAGSALPIPESVHTEDLVGAGAGGSANRVAMAPGTGYFAQTVGQNASSPPAGSLFWISDTGVRYGIDNEAGITGNVKTADALGLTAPATPIPWAVLSLYAPGPTLSRADALLAHDGLAPDSRPGRTSAEGQDR